MKKLGFIVILLTLLLAFEAAAQSYNSFAGIQFGSSRESVLEDAMKMGYEVYSPRGASDRLAIPVFLFGDLPVQVDFLFNKNDKFYSFEIRTGRVERARLDKAFEAVGYMSEQFTLKYGKPSGSPALNENSSLKESIMNIYQQWYSVKVLDAYTGLVQKDGRYFAVGAVTHRTLAKEKSSGKSAGKEKASSAPVF
ncbi:MAG: hypothetical protein MJZ26_13170 [Fibrobacter sp.]|nr:hypothetical protein [Fibrobacter sp.]